MDVTVNVSLVVDDWQGRDGYRVDPFTNIDLSAHDLHSGATYPASITLPQDTADELRKAIRRGYRLVVWVSEAEIESVDKTGLP